MSAPDGILYAGNDLGECILWNGRRRELWWTDIPARKLHQHDWHTGHTRVLDAPDRIASFGFVANDDSLIAAFAPGVALYEPWRKSVTWLTLPETALAPGIRFNDGRVDRSGRFWSGTMVEGASAAAGGCLYCVGPAGAARRHLQNIRISNGLCFSPAGTCVYFADSPTRTISEFPLLEPAGTLGERRQFIQTPAGAFPDGATVDADGCIWTALWGAGCVARYTPDGRLDRRVMLPVSQPSCVCFGSDSLDVLCVTTAREGLSPAELAAQPHAGDVLLYRVGVQGLPEHEYRP
jgi:sugar lactone lactonase YvrE